MFIRVSACLLLAVMLPHGCSCAGPPPARLQHRAVGDSPQLIALYEAWFGHPDHIKIDYSSHDPAVLDGQIQSAQKMGITAFVVDWYGDRQPFIDRSYALMQATAAKKDFQVAMMYEDRKSTRLNS